MSKWINMNQEKMFFFNSMKLKKKSRIPATLPLQNRSPSNQTPKILRNDVYFRCQRRRLAKSPKRKHRTQKLIIFPRRFLPKYRKIVRLVLSFFLTHTHDSPLSRACQAKIERGKNWKILGKRKKKWTSLFHSSEAGITTRRVGKSKAISPSVTSRAR